MKGDYQLYHTHFINIPFISNYALHSCGLSNNIVQEWDCLLYTSDAADE